MNPPEELMYLSSGKSMTIFVAAYVRSEAKRMVVQLWSSILSKTMKID